MDHLKTKVKEHELDRAEGEELKKLAIQYGIEKKKLDQIRIEEKLQLGMWSKTCHKNLLPKCIYHNTYG